MSDHPVYIQERIELLDVLRGIALFGILVVNMRFFDFPTEVCEPRFYWMSTLDQITENAIKLFFNEKFYSLFSLLFGIGFGLQMNNLTAKRGNGAIIYGRRLFILFLFGLGHGVFIWWGDVLAVYAFLGFFLMLFRPLNSRWILVASVLFLLTPIAVSTIRLSSGDEMSARPAYSQVQNESDASQMDKKIAQVHDLIDKYSKGTYRQILTLRLEQLKINYEAWLFRSYGFQVFGMFLFGLYLVKSRIVRNLEQHRPIIRKVWKFSLWLSLAGIVLFLATNYTRIGNIYFIKLFSFEFEKINRTTMCLFYASSVVLLCSSDFWKRKFAVFVPLGRTALTNYLLQSILCSLIFYGYGLQHYGNVAPSVSFVLAAVVFLCQLIFSAWWVKRNRFGPMEWLWRSFTYGMFQPMRVHKSEQKSGLNL